jgi:hypothetical protein
MAAYYNSFRKTINWCRKMLIEIICGTMLVNAWCQHTKFGADTKFGILEFREKIIDDLLTEKKIFNIIPIEQKKTYL